MSWYNSGVFWNAVAFSFQMVFGATENFVQKKFVYCNFLFKISTFLWKVTMFVRIHCWWYFWIKYILSFLEGKFWQKKMEIVFFGPYLLPKRPNMLKSNALKKLCLVIFCQKILKNASKKKKKLKHHVTHWNKTLNVMFSDFW